MDFISMFNGPGERNSIPQQGGLNIFSNHSINNVINYLEKRYRGDLALEKHYKETERIGECILNYKTGKYEHITSDIKGSNPGGVDLSMKVEDLKKNMSFKNITGLYIDDVDRPFFTINNTYPSYLQTDIDLVHLVVALYVFYNKEIKNKDISFSLDPIYEENGSQPAPILTNQKLVYFPDKWNGGKDIISGTELGQILFEADWLMKQLAMGLEVTCIKPLKIQERNKIEYENIGIMPITSGYLHSRMWLSVGEMYFKKLEKKGGKFSLIIDSIRMRVDAKETELKNMMLIDKEVQNKANPAFAFANSFTLNYDKIENKYPIFRRLKQASKAVILAQYMYINNIPIDFKLIECYYSEHRLDFFKKNGPILKTLPLLTYTTDRYVVTGGVTMPYIFKELMENKKNSTEKKEIIEIKKPKINTTSIKEIPSSYHFPFFQTTINCMEKSCKSVLEFKEMINCHMESYYCEKHNKNTCSGCLEILNKIIINVDGKNYHEDCFLCIACGKKLEKKFKIQKNILGDNEFFLHLDCPNKKLSETTFTQDFESNNYPDTNISQQLYINQLITLAGELVRKGFGNFEDCYKALEMCDLDINSAVNYLIDQNFTEIINPPSGTNVLPNFTEPNSLLPPELMYLETKIIQFASLLSEKGIGSFNKCFEELILLSKDLKNRNLGSFSLEQCLEALMECDLDINKAANQLLNI